MRENSFYIDTVKDFRDRRYEYKHKAKVEKDRMAREIAAGNLSKAQEAKDLTALYDSL
jgi:DNA polymerase epsilon subunit 1